MSQPRVILGIDFGATNSVVCTIKLVVDVDVAHVIPVLGEQTCPTALAKDEDGKLLLGHAALGTARPVTAWKRIIGLKYTDVNANEKLLASLPFVPIQCERSEGRLMPSVKFKDEDTQDYLANELTALYLDQLLSTAGYEKHEHINLVISHPAAFREHQKTALRDVVRLLHATRPNVVLGPIVAEPAAAAIEAVRLALAKEGDYIVCYDLGGGTFDASVLCARAHTNMDILASSGEEFVGGQDLDSRLYKFLCDEKGVHFVDKAEGLKEARMMKEKLSARGVDGVRTTFRQADGNTVVQVMRSEAHAIWRPILEKTFIRLRMVLADAAAASGVVNKEERPKEDTLEWVTNAATLMAAKVKTVLFVGGATRAPLVKEMMAEFLDGAFAEKISGEEEGVNPDTYVAQGAAALAFKYFGAKKGLSEMWARTSYNLGVETWNPMPRRHELVIIVRRRGHGPAQPAVVHLLDGRPDTNPRGPAAGSEGAVAGAAGAEAAGG